MPSFYHPLNINQLFLLPFLVFVCSTNLANCRARKGGHERKIALVHEINKEGVWVHIGISEAFCISHEGGT